MFFVLLALGNLVNRSVPHVFCGLFGTFVDILQPSSFSASNYDFGVMFPMDKIAITRQTSLDARVSSDSYDVQFEISRLADEDIALPTLVKLASTNANDLQQFDLLFPLHSITDFLLEQLRPTDLKTEIFSVSRFNDAINSWQIHLRHLALEHPSEARRFGRLARLLRDRAALFRLAKMYSSALLQG